MATIDSNEEFFGVLQALIEKWCDRRCLKALYRILGAYLSFNGLTDGWNELRTALQDVRTFARTELTADELKDVDGLIRAAESALHK